MTNLGEMLNPDILRRLANQSISVGNVYRIEMDKANGIVPKPGDISRNKFFVVLGWDDNGTIYGGIVINSEINPHLPPLLKQYHIPISHAKYAFLKYDSYADCVALKSVNVDKFGGWEFLGQLDTNDTEAIKAKIKTSPRESPANLARFGL